MDEKELQVVTNAIAYTIETAMDTNFGIRKIDIPNTTIEMYKAAAQKAIEHLDEYRDAKEKVYGVWFVYNFDGGAYPMNVFNNELHALRYAITNYGYVVFWEHGQPWDTEFIKDGTLLKPIVSVEDTKVLNISACDWKWKQYDFETHEHKCYHNEDHLTVHACECGAKLGLVC